MNLVYKVTNLEDMVELMQNHFLVMSGIPNKNFTEKVNFAIRESIMELSPGEKSMALNLHKMITEKDLLIIQKTNLSGIDETYLNYLGERGSILFFYYIMDIIKKSIKKVFLEGVPVIAVEVSSIKTMEDLDALELPREVKEFLAEQIFFNGSCEKSSKEEKEGLKFLGTSIFGTSEGKKFYQN